MEIRNIPFLDDYLDLESQAFKDAKYIIEKAVRRLYASYFKMEINNTIFSAFSDGFGLHWCELYIQQWIRSNNRYAHVERLHQTKWCLDR